MPIQNLSNNTATFQSILPSSTLESFLIQRWIHFVSKSGQCWLVRLQPNYFFRMSTKVSYTPEYWVHAWQTSWQSHVNCQTSRLILRWLHLFLTPSDFVFPKRICFSEEVHCTFTYVKGAYHMCWTNPLVLRPLQCS